MQVTTQFLVIIPIVLGLVQVAKVSGLSTRWAPLTSIVLGVIGAYLIGGWAFSGAVVLQGIIAGLSAAGLWSGTSSTISSTTA